MAHARSGESAGLLPLWPGFDSRTRRHMWVEFVVGSRPCLACEQAHIWEHTRERQRANSKPERSFREESGDEGRLRF